MDQITSHRQHILSAMNAHAEYLAGANLPKVEYSVLTDEQRNRYQLLAIGWDQQERVFTIIFHADIINNHIWIQEDNTEIGFATLLVEQGVPQSEIVLAYYPEYHRKYTDFAVV
jgi:XisI protein